MRHALKISSSLLIGCLLMQPLSALQAQEAEASISAPTEIEANETPEIIVAPLDTEEATTTEELPEQNEESNADESDSPESPEDTEQAEPAVEPVPEISPAPEESELNLPAGTEYVPGEVLVKFKERKIDLEDAGGESDAEEVIDSLDLEIEETIDDANIVVVDTGSTSTADAIASLKNDPTVEFAEPNFLYRINAIDSNDTHRALLWAIENTGQTVRTATGTPDADLDAQEAWELSKGAGVTVAVIDTGVDYTHPDLAPNMWGGTNCVNENGAALGGCIHGYDFYRNDLDPAPEHDHGTHVAGIIAAAKGNGQGIIGIAPEAKIMALRTDFEYYDSIEQATSTALSTAGIVRAIDFARHNGAKVINASFGGPSESISMRDAIGRFGTAGGIFIAAAGNEGDDNDTNPFYPANSNLANVVSVAASDQKDELAGFSNYGDSVDVTAPGVNILSTVPDGWEYKNGTSMASPHAAAIAALLFAYDPSLTVNELREALLTSGEDIPELSGEVSSGKRMNAFDALASVATTPVTGSLNVSLSLVNDNYRTAATSSFAFKLDGGRSRSFGTGTTTLALAPGTYAITGIATSTYSLPAGSCTVTLAVGSTSECVLVFDDLPDTVAPVITRTGANPQVITRGGTYTELGATAMDDVDGNLSASITTNASAVNTATAGTYAVTYSVSDRAGNTATTTRTVSIQAPRSSGGGGGGGGGGGSSSKKSSKKSEKKQETTKKKETAKPQKKRIEKRKSSPVPEPILRTVASLYQFTLDRFQGAQGTDITELQNALQRSGFLTATPTGYFGPLTADALRRYQIAKGVAATGYLDAATRAKLNASVNSSVPVAKSTAMPIRPSNFSTPQTSSVSLQGAQGTLVSQLQSLLRQAGYLSVAPTGYYGPLTADALRRYQTAGNAAASQQQVTTLISQLSAGKR